MKPQVPNQPDAVCVLQRPSLHRMTVPAAHAYWLPVWMAMLTMKVKLRQHEEANFLAKCRHTSAWAAERIKHIKSEMTIR